MEPCAPHAQQCDQPTPDRSAARRAVGRLGATPVNPPDSSPASDTGAAEEGDSISATAAPGADGRTAPVATTFPSTAAGELVRRSPCRGPAHRTTSSARPGHQVLALAGLLLVAADLGPADQRGDRSALGPLVGSLGHRRRRRCGGRRLHDHPAADPLPGLLVRDLVDGDRHPETGSSSSHAASCRCIACRPCASERGPMADHYRMTNLKIRTAAGSVQPQRTGPGRG